VPPASSNAAQVPSIAADAAAQPPSSTFSILSDRVSSALQDAKRRVTEHVDESMQSLAKPHNRLKTSGAKTMAGVSVKGLFFID
jgi:DNA-binding protein YbaB